MLGCLNFKKKPVMSSCPCALPAPEAQAGRLLFLAYVLLGDFLTFDWQLGANSSPNLGRDPLGKMG